MTKSYEELMGAIGRGILFRPERFRVRDLLSKDTHPRLLVGERVYTLFDISMNGISFFDQSYDSSFRAGDEIPVSLALHDKMMYSGVGRVARTQSSAKGVRVGLALTKGFLDINEIRRQDEEARLRRELQSGPVNQLAFIPSPYLEALTRAVHFVQYYRKSFDRHEARYRSANIDTTQLANRGLEAIREPWSEICHAASIAGLDCLGYPEIMRAAKECTETMLTPLLLDAPMVHRSYTKPLGYPGDYRVMMYYYDNKLEGGSVFAQVFHKLFIEHPLSNGVRTRCDFVVGLMQKEHDRVIATNQGGTFRVTSLGCGPARESAEYIAQRRDWSGDAIWTLIDQEDQTLSVAYNDCHREIAKAGARGRIQCLNVSFSQVLDDPTLVPLSDPQDLIFSVGLFDYLREVRAQELIGGLYDRLAPGGLLTVGNAAGPNEYSWSPEFILDWTLIYRTRDEMLRLTQNLPKGAEIDVVLEPGQAYYFLLIRKHPHAL